MPITILDLVLLGVMLISGLLAMVRGFMREILSIAAWGAAALVTLYAFGKLLPTAKTYFNNDTVASVVVVAGVFVGTLIVVSIITGWSRKSSVPTGSPGPSPGWSCREPGIG
jgi:membrane protein required for colicin V production